MGKYVTGALVGLALAAMLALAVSLGGWVNVGAVWPDPPPVAWWLHTTYERSVARHAADVDAPLAADDTVDVLAGARAFDQMCSVCHTPPGQSPTVQSQGLNPGPPELSRLLAARTPKQAFWVIRNGVRMTGMPAFGPTHSDRQLWQLVAFLGRVQGLDADGYSAMMAAARELPGDGHKHRHGNDAPLPTDPKTDAAAPVAPAASTGGHPHAPGEHHQH
ncbi:cytochrome c [Immundisolibacter sp.]|uniref:c-type cytochrome n=1 Tax=Immundisolibacter sp. TaxID=1934948 RepID=UPI0035682DE7